MSITIKAMSKKDEEARKEVIARSATLVGKGICPTCENFRTGGVYPNSQERIFYKDKLIICLLEEYPRGVGHTILLSRKHYEDISEMPYDLGCHFVRISKAVVTALKELTGAVKVYQVTMCSGAVNHLHFQLIPRLSGDMMGGRVFSIPRSVLTDYRDTIPLLNVRLKKLLTDGNFPSLRGATNKVIQPTAKAAAD
jgi:diadenosine tetraphosphate (Ap4A) HIT family hydrolase